MKPGAGSRMLSLLLTVVFAYAALALLAYVAADRLMFLPPPPSYDAHTLPIVHVSGEDGARIAVLHLPRPDARFTIIYSHGNAEDLGHIAPVLQVVGAAGYSVIGYDYRGYGASTGGGPSVAGAVRDLEAVYRYATVDLRIPADAIILHGRSIGSGPATDLAAREPVAGLILESAFTSTFVVVTRVRMLPFDRFDNLRLIRGVGAPVLVIHGTRDEVIPFRHGRTLHDAAPGPKQALWVDGARHNDIVARAAEPYAAALRAFETLLTTVRP